MSEAAFGPTPAAQRIGALDVLRGAAVLGILMVNILYFSLPLVDVMMPPAPGALEGADLACWALVKVLFEYMFISIFSLLFGAGMVVQMHRAEAAGRPFAPVYLRRLATLALIGLAHGLLLWYGDILFFYACVGLVVFYLRTLPPRAMLLGAIIGFVMALAIPGAFGLLGAWKAALQPPGDVAMEAPNADEAPAVPPGGDDPWQAWVESVKRVAEDPEDVNLWREVELRAYRDGPLGAALLVRGATFVTLTLGEALGGLGFRTAAFFLLGAALMKLGFFERRFRRWHWALCLVGLPAGVALEAIGAWLGLQVGAGRPIALALFDTVHQTGSLVLAMGYVGTITLVTSSDLGRMLLRPVAAVGRMALTNYLLETVIATGIMYWWGLGRFDSFSHAELVGIVAIVYAGLVVFSVLWLRFFRIGPAEWAWRSLTYWQPQPLSR